ncbi:hypothetical protein [Nostoc sp.]|uniref:hypothetical protein n=1 Tax=Nostoc sp. TaxID=1180 RepID=UPI002FF55499
MSLIQSLSPEFRQCCEALATEQRSLLRVRAFEPLAVDTLAAKLGATLFRLGRLPNLEPEQVTLLLVAMNGQERL